MIERFFLGEEFFARPQPLILVTISENHLCPRSRSASIARGQLAFFNRRGPALCAVFVSTPEPSCGVRQVALIPPAGSTVEKLIGGVEGFEAARVARVGVIDDAVLQSKGAETCVLLCNNVAAVADVAPGRREIIGQPVRIGA